MYNNVIGTSLSGGRADWGVAGSTPRLRPPLERNAGGRKDARQAHIHSRREKPKHSCVQDRRTLYDTGTVGERVATPAVGGRILRIHNAHTT